MDEASKRQCERERAVPDPPSTPLSFLRLPWPDSSDKPSKRTKPPAAPRFLQFLLSPQDPNAGTGEKGSQSQTWRRWASENAAPPFLVASIDLTVAARSSSFRSPRKCSILSPTVRRLPPAGEFLGSFDWGSKAASGLSVLVLDF